MNTPKHSRTRVLVLVLVESNQPEQTGISYSGANYASIVAAIVSPHASLTVAHYYNHDTKKISNFLYPEAILQNKYFYHYFLFRICAAFRLLMVDDKPRLKCRHCHEHFKYRI